MSACVCNVLPIYGIAQHTRSILQFSPREARSKMAVADIVIKQESIEAVDLESKILLLCKENRKGITDAIIQQSMPSIPAQQRVMAINRLLSTVLHYIQQTFTQRFARGVAVDSCTDFCKANEH